MSEVTQGFMTEKEFLAQIKVCRATLNKFKSKKLISYFKVGRRILYNSQSLEDFKNNCVRQIESSRNT
jgi:hypothetical protein